MSERLQREQMQALPLANEEVTDMQVTWNSRRNKIIFSQLIISSNGSSLKKIQLTIEVPLSLSTSNLHENTFLGQCWESYCYPIKEKYIPD